MPVTEIQLRRFYVDQVIGLLNLWREPTLEVWARYKLTCYARNAWKLFANMMTLHMITLLATLQIALHAWVNNTHCFRTPFFSMQMRRADSLRWLPSVIWKQNPHQFDDEINLRSNVSWYLSIYLSSSFLNCVLLWKPNTQFLQTLVHTSVTYSGHSEHAQWHVQYPLILLVCFG
jgi:hypothetical protein